MAEAEIKKFSQFSFYVTAQIDRINSALQDNNHVLVKIQQINAHMKRQQNKIHEVDSKVRLLEVYQSQNFKNNERLFNSQLTFDALDKKMLVLEQMQSEIISHAEQKMITANEQTKQHMYILQQKLKTVQNQLQKIRGRNVTLSKFRRDVSPNNVNCDSTKDISIDRKSNCTSNEVKKIEVKIHEYINQRLKIFEKKFYSALNADRQRLFDFQLPDLENESFLKNRLTLSKQKSTQKSQNVYQMNRDIKRQSGNQHHFRNTIDSYYNQATQKQDIRMKKNHKQQHKLQKHPLKTQNSHSKSKSKKKTKDHSSKKSISLKSVNEYLKLAGKGK